MDNEGTKYMVVKTSQVQVDSDLALAKSSQCLFSLFSIGRHIEEGLKKKSFPTIISEK